MNGTHGREAGHVQNVPFERHTERPQWTSAIVGFVPEQNVPFYNVIKCFSLLEISYD
jgi:hypothetical protein